MDISYLKNFLNEDHWKTIEQTFLVSTSSGENTNNNVGATIHNPNGRWSNNTPYQQENQLPESRETKKSSFVQPVLGVEDVVEPKSATLNKSTAGSKPLSKESSRAINDVVVGDSPPLLLDQELEKQQSWQSEPIPSAPIIEETDLLHIVCTKDEILPYQIERQNTDITTITKNKGQPFYEIIKTFSSFAGSFIDRVRSVDSMSEPPELQKSPSNHSKDSGFGGDTVGTTGSASFGEANQQMEQNQDIAPATMEPYSPTEGIFFCDTRDEPKRKKKQRKQARIEIEQLRRQQDHFKFCAHGVFWTTIAVITSWGGLIFSILSRRSPNFVNLETPIYFDGNFDRVSEMGLVRFQLCYNETLLAKNDCFYQYLDSDDVNDRMFELSRSLVSLAIIIGAFMTIFVTTTIYWQSINLRPLGFGFIVAYFMQSLVFLFFDSDLCSEHTCKIGKGCVYIIVGSCLWLVACIASARMDTVKFRKLVKQRRRSKSRSKSPEKTRNKATLARGTSTGTQATQNTEASMERDFEIVQGIEDVEAAQAWAARVASRKEQSRSNSPSKRFQKNNDDNIVQIECAMPKPDRSFECLEQYNISPRGSWPEQVFPSGMKQLTTSPTPRPGSNMFETQVASPGTDDGTKSWDSMVNRSPSPRRHAINDNKNNNEALLLPNFIKQNPLTPPSQVPRHRTRARSRIRSKRKNDPSKSPEKLRTTKKSSQEDLDPARKSRNGHYDIVASEAKSRSKHRISSPSKNQKSSERQSSPNRKRPSSPGKRQKSLSSPHPKNGGETSARISRSSTKKSHRAQVVDRVESPSKQRYQEPSLKVRTPDNSRSHKQKMRPRRNSKSQRASSRSRSRSRSPHKSSTRLHRTPNKSTMFEI